MRHRMSVKSRERDALTQLLDRIQDLSSPKPKHSTEAEKYASIYQVEIKAAWKREWTRMLREAAIDGNEEDVAKLRQKQVGERTKWLNARWNAVDEVTKGKVWNQLNQEFLDEIKEWEERHSFEDERKPEDYLKYVVYIMYIEP